MKSAVKYIIYPGILILIILMTGFAEGGSQSPVNRTAIYPAVANATESNEFRVRVNNEAAFVEEYIPGPIENNYALETVEGRITYHYAQFAFEGTAKIVIESESGFDGYQLSPRRYDLSHTIRGNTLRLTLNQPKDLVLKIGSHWLYILPDPIDHDAPEIGDFHVANIMDYDVDPTGQTLNTFEIQKAIIDVSTGPDAGGVLYFPAGVYRTGTLEMYSHVTLYLAPGAVLQASSDPKDFPLPFGPNHQTEEDADFPSGPPGRDYGYDYALLRIHHAKDVTVKGAGILDAVPQ